MCDLWHHLISVCRHCELSGLKKKMEKKKGGGVGGGEMLDSKYKLLLPKTDYNLTNWSLQ